MKHLILITGLLLFFTTPLQAAVQGREVNYRAGDTVLKGYLAFDDAIKGKRPGILVVHECTYKLLQQEQTGFLRV